MEKIDIVVLSYNQDRFIEECIQSILNQSYKNISVKVFDDNSTDQTRSILSKIKDPRLNIYYNNYNLGVTANHNKAISYVKSKFFVLTGGDDIFYKHKIMNQYNFMSKNPNYAICGHDVNIIDTKSKILSKRKTIKWNRNGLGYNKWLHNGMLCVAFSLMYNTKYFNTKYDDRLPYASDWKLVIDLLQNKNRYHILKIVLGGYRKHEKSLTKVHRNKCINDQLNALKILFNENQIKEDEYKKSLSYHHNYRLLIEYVGNINPNIGALKALKNLFIFGKNFYFLNLRFYYGLFIFSKKFLINH